MALKINRSAAFALIFTAVMGVLLIENALSIPAFAILTFLIFFFAILSRQEKTIITLPEAKRIVIYEAKKMQRSNPPELPQGDLRLMGEGELKTLIVSDQQGATIDPDKYDIVVKIGDDIYWMFTVSIYGNITGETQVYEKSIKKLEETYRKVESKGGARSSVGEKLKDRYEEAKENYPKE